MSIELRSLPAYRLFIEETHHHVGFFADLLEDTQDVKSLDLVEARRRIHMVRGGAGFFALPKLARFAGQAEELLIAETHDLQALRRILNSLEKERDRLPPPRN